MPNFEIADFRSDQTSPKAMSGISEFELEAGKYEEERSINKRP
jgi:hypothetical protein